MLYQSRMKIFLFSNLFIGICFIPWASTQLTSTTNLKELPPIQDGPVKVSIGIYVNTISEINEKKMDFTLNMYFRESWVDKRLKTNQTSVYNVPNYHFRKYWYPDLFFRNEKHSTTHNLMVENRLLRIRSDGNVWHVRKITATFTCPMYFQDFPFDQQTCPILIESFTHTMDTLYLEWMDHATEWDSSMNLPKFSLTDTVLHDCSQNYTSGAYPCLAIYIVLTRHIWYSLTTFFLPTIFVVLLAWTSFWIKTSSTVYRIVVSSVAFYFIVQLRQGIKEGLPVINYITAADIWTIICLIFVMFTIVVHIVINLLLNVTNKPQKSDNDSEKVAVESDDKCKKKDKFIQCLKKFVLGEGLMNVSDVEKCKRNAFLLNAMSRLIMVVLFVITIIVYFCLFTCK